VASCGNIGAKSGVGVDYLSVTLAFSHTFLNPGMGDAMGVSEIRSRGERPGFDYGQNVWPSPEPPIPLPGRTRTPAFGYLA
jgi:hypothetical protein